VDNGSNDACGIASMAVAPNTFDCSNVGANTVTLAVTDNNGNTSSSTATVTVEDHVPATVLTQDITVQLDASGNVSITANDVDNGSNDACGILSMSVSPSAFSCSDVGLNTVTLTITDVNGNISSETAVVTVEDHVAPIAQAKDITVQLDNNGAVSIVPQDVDNNSNDACGIASLSVSPNTFGCGNTGANTVTLTVTDNHGNVSTTTSIVTVEDQVSPTLSCPGSQERCANITSNNTYKVVGTEFDLSAMWDNCSIVSVSNDLTGLSSLDGYVFNNGTTTVIWTVEDASGNKSSCSFDVTVYVLPVAGIDATGADEWCNGVQLTATGTTEAPYTYAWSTSETTETIVLQLNTSSAGTYTMLITDVHGCTSPTAASYTYSPEALNSSYTLLGFEMVKLGEDDKVLEGSVGVSDKKGHAILGKDVEVSGQGSFVKADKITKHPSATATTINGQATVTLPTMYFYEGDNSGHYSTVKVQKNTTQTVTSNKVSVKVEEGATVTLTGDDFGEIEVEAGGTVIFTADTVDIVELEVEGSRKKHKNTTSINMSYVIFSSDAAVRVEDEVKIEGDVLVNPDGYKVVFHIGSEPQQYSKSCKHNYSHHGSSHHGGSSHSSGSYKEGKLDIKKGGTTFNASAYVPEGKISVEGVKCQSGTTYMNGFYIAEEIMSNGKDVIWNWHECYQNTSIGSPKLISEEQGPAGTGENKLKAYPNPFSNVANVEFSAVESGQAKVEVYDMVGQRVATLFDGEVEAGDSYMEVFHADNLSTGVYFIRLTTGDSSLVKRIILAD